MPSLTDLGQVYQNPQPEQTMLQKLGQTWPARMAKDALSALMLPGDVYQGNVPMVGDDGRTSLQAIGRATDLAGLMMGGTYASPSPRGAVLGSGPTRSRLPSSNSLVTPPAPTAEAMARSARLENVDLASVRGTQPKMEWERFDKRESPGPLIKGYEDFPIAVRREDGEYLIFDGHHRAAQAIADGNANLKMHVIDAKDYAPEFAGRKPAADKISTDDLLRKLFE